MCDSADCMRFYEECAGSTGNEWASSNDVRVFVVLRRSIVVASPVRNLPLVRSSKADRCQVERDMRNQWFNDVYSQRPGQAFETLGELSPNRPLSLSCMGELVLADLLIHTRE